MSQPLQKAEKQAPVATLLENKFFVLKDYGPLIERGYGKKLVKRLELSFTEALYLLEKEKITVNKGKVKLSFAALMKMCHSLDKRIHEKYTVYKDMRERGLLVKTGFKFGSDFRVYGRGVLAVKKGVKAPSEHTKWVVYCVPEDYTCSFQELSRSVRLAHSIRAKMLWAIVDNEANVTYYEVIRALL